MDKTIIEKVLDQAREEEANLVIWDRRDTFTIEADDLSEVELADGYFQAKMQEGQRRQYSSSLIRSTSW